MTSVSRASYSIAVIGALLLAAHAAGPAAAPSTGTAAPSARRAVGFRSPVPPEHRRRNLTTPSELAEDFRDVVLYLYDGQAYFRAYQKGSHTVEENAQFLKFLETYERELEVAKKEVKTLGRWVGEKGSLDSVVTR